MDMAHYVKFQNDNRDHHYNAEWREYETAWRKFGEAIPRLMGRDLQDRVDLCYEAEWRIVPPPYMRREIGVIPLFYHGLDVDYYYEDVFLSIARQDDVERDIKRLRYHVQGARKANAVFKECFQRTTDLTKDEREALSAAPALFANYVTKVSSFIAGLGFDLKLPADIK